MPINSPIQINGYYIEYSRLPTLSTDTRTLLIINKKIPFTRRYDLEDRLISSIWIEIPINKSTK